MPLTHVAMPKLQPTLDSLKACLRSQTESGRTPNSFTVQKLILAEHLTPNDAYLKLARPGSADSTQSFLLESATAGERLERYSFIGTNPRRVIRTGSDYEGGCVDPLILLEEELNRYTPARQAEALPPFTGGAVGYISYDCIKYFEPKTVRELKDTLRIPEAVLMLFDTIVAFDNVFQRIHVLHTLHTSADPSDAEWERAYNDADGKIDGIIEILQGEQYEVSQPRVEVNGVYKSNIGEEGYERHVARLKEHIKKGDIIQAVPSQRVAHPTDLHPFNIYRQLRTVNPSPYMFYFDFKDFAVIGASPETLVKLEAGRVVTHPIAGTVRRGASIEEDEQLATQLMSSAKDRAEHVMLVDLARNDINRVCDPLTSSVDQLMQLERFSHVSHLVSRCSGVLRADKTRFDAFRSVFPAGTVSGAPKVKAMELIGELEGEVRGVYAGAAGHWGYDKEVMNTCIALRTMLYKDGTVYLQAGGGIVYDSDPHEEYVETMNKMRANRICLEEAEELWAQRTEKQARASLTPSNIEK